MMKRPLRQSVGKAIRRVSDRLLEAALSYDKRKRIDRISAIDKGMQILLSSHYRSLMHHGGPLPHIRDVEFSAFSDGGEDGILLYIFSLVGTTDRRVVEICAGDGITCNAANLIANHGWTGLLVDGDPRSIARGSDFYAHCRETRLWPPILRQAWVTAENVNSIIRDAGFMGEIDLLSLDIDGVDYWIWEAINCIQPRVVVLEYQDAWGPDRAVTVPYDPNFRVEVLRGGARYSGASLAAFVKLGRKKGYRLVGSQSYGFNAFFVRSGVGEETLPEAAPIECLYHPRAQAGMARLVPYLLERPWIEVG